MYGSRLIFWQKSEKEKPKTISNSYISTIYSTNHLHTDHGRVHREVTENDTFFDIFFGILCRYWPTNCYNICSYLTFEHYQVLTWGFPI